MIKLRNSTDWQVKHHAHRSRNEQQPRVLQDAAHRVHGRGHLTAQCQKGQQQHQAQHRAGDEGQGELGQQLAWRLEEKKLQEALDHGFSVVN